MKTTILIPLKNPVRAKQRMASLLTERERESLSWAMFHDVMETLSQIDAPVAIVTSSRDAAKIARRRGWCVFHEEHQQSESDSVDWASVQLAQMGTEAVLRLPADLPLIEASDITQLLLASTRCDALIVPSRDLLGTNALLRSPPNLFPSRFGHNSFIFHMREVLKIGAGLHICQSRRIGCDLDKPSDIEYFLKEGSSTRTHGFLENINIRERITTNAIS